MAKDQSPDTESVVGTERRSYCDAERRQIVEETYAPGASVSMVARRHDVNADLVFKWRQRYGRRTEQVETGFLPVAVAEPAALPEALRAIPAAAPKRRRARKPAAEASFIEIDLAGGHRGRVHGTADTVTCTIPILPKTNIIVCSIHAVHAIRRLAQEETGSPAVA